MTALVLNFTAEDDEPLDYKNTTAEERRKRTLEALSRAVTQPVMDEDEDDDEDDELNEMEKMGLAIMGDFDDDSEIPLPPKNPKKRSKTSAKQADAVAKKKKNEEVVPPPPPPPPPSAPITVPGTTAQMTEMLKQAYTTPYAAPSKPNKANFCLEKQPAAMQRRSYGSDGRSLMPKPFRIRYCGENKAVVVGAVNVCICDAQDKRLLPEMQDGLHGKLTVMLDECGEAAFEIIAKVTTVGKQVRLAFNVLYILERMCYEETVYSDLFEIRSNPNATSHTLVVDGISRGSGSLRGGDEVWLCGVNFQSSKTYEVSFGIHNASVIDVRASLIRVRTPPQLKTGTVKVIVREGGRVSKALAFRYE